ncbi:MAG: hypothetical protein LBE92_01660 [Chryseobacterium sp.]|jgi:hypothetical protein|uniref:glycine-rich domain-containing protein n=1 Tax=Chryseobacterium sp. TaxID=1871047 RepID=UPI00283A50AC|nr:hypothetical protein [Chryseobacterium sp.]MDR2234804.1 hypothetical protein [Chryseobacterium sp.]
METTMIIKDESLWNRIQGFSLDASNACFPFSKKLAKEENWSLEFTGKAIEEYKKFVYLCCILPQGASPSETVDKVWHMHLIYTQSYWEEFCPEILRRKLHHHPSKGGGQEQNKHQNWFLDTLSHYKSIFLQEPPEEIWQPEKKEKPERSWLKKLRVIPLFSLLFLLSSCLGEVIATFAIIVVSFLGIFSFGVIVALFQDASDRRNKDGGGSGESSGSSCSGGSSGSSCGGGGCGGGCGGCGGCGG